MIMFAVYAPSFHWRELLHGHFWPANLSIFLKIENNIQRGTRLCFLRFSSFYSRKKKVVQRVCRNPRIVSLLGVERSWGTRSLSRYIQPGDIWEQMWNYGMEWQVSMATLWSKEHRGDFQQFSSLQNSRASKFRIYRKLPVFL